jgi:murein DD-endopeptidase MepM/ murein hydrolase activator NlpD
MIKNSISIVIVPHSSGKPHTIFLHRYLLSFLLVFSCLTVLCLFGIIFSFTFNYMQMHEKMEPTKFKMNNLVTENQTLNSAITDAYSNQEDLAQLLKEEREKHTQSLMEINERLKLLEKFYADLRIMAGFKLNADDAKALDKIAPESLDAHGGPPEVTDKLFDGVDITQLPHNDYLQFIEQKKLELLSEINKNVNAIESVKRLLESKSSQVADVPSLVPVNGTITSLFGEIRPGGTHGGLDIAAPEGTPIYAPADGVVIKSGPSLGYGRVIIIDHGNGYTTRFGHLSAENVSVGDRVEEGDIIGYVGSTGWATGPHLHYEVRLNGVPVDPLNYMSTKLPQKLINNVNSPDTTIEDLPPSYPLVEDLPLVEEEK